MTNKEKYLNAFTETFEITAEETRGGNLSIWGFLHGILSDI